MQEIISLIVLVGLSATFLCVSLYGERGELHPGDPVVYVGAVLEYEPFNHWGEGGGEAIIKENSRIIAQYASQAKAQGADILVAPEYGLQGLDMHASNPEELFSLMQFVPDPELGVVACSMDIDSGHVEAMKTLSCAARENQIYLVADLTEAKPCRSDTAANNPFGNALDTADQCPSNGYIYYNVQVVFDRKGTLIARYRKKNLYLESFLTAGTESDDTAIFTTDFGVTFTLQVCFDIAFRHPGLTNVLTRGIKDVAMSTAWVDILPFMPAPSVQNAWPRELGVNLLVSGHHRPEYSKLGSGIYRGFSDLGHIYTFDPDSGSKMLVSEVETVAFAEQWQKFSQKRPAKAFPKSKGKLIAKGSGSVERSDGPRRKHLFIYDDLSNYTQVVLEKSDSGAVQHAAACHQDSLCCTLSYTPSASLNYSLLAYSGPVVLGFGEFQIYSQVCAVVWCRTDDVRSCGRMDDGSPPGDDFGPIVLVGNFSVDQVFATVMTRNLTLIDNDQYALAGEGRIRTLRTHEPTRGLMTGVLYGRWYERDPDPNLGSGELRTMTQ